LKAQEWYRTYPGRKEIQVWFDLTPEIFTEFVTSGGHPGAQQPTPTTSHEKQATDSTLNAAFDFLKGIKRDVTQYKELSDDKKWTMWHRHLKSMAPIHGIENVLNSEYKPSTSAESELFKQQQSFAYSVFERCLRTAKSMKFTREYEKSRDAQALYRDLVKAYESGVSAELREEAIREYIQNLRLTSAWNKPLETFLVHFEHKLLDLEQTCHKPVSPEDKRKWLTSAIRGHEQLYQVASMSKVVMQTNGKSSSAQ
jgi:hypothetical protein